MADDENSDKSLAIVAFKMRIIWGLLIAALTIAGGSLIAVARCVYARGGDERESAITLRLLVEHDAEHAKRIREVEDQSARCAQRLDDINTHKVTP